MSNAEPQLEAMTALLDELAVGEAAEKALSGSHAGAERILADVLKRTPDSLAALDLSARVSAQQGRFEDAAGKWRRVLELAPGNVSAAAGIARIDGLRRYPIWTLWAPALTALLAGVVLLGAAAGMATARLDRDRDQAARQMALTSDAQKEGIGEVSKRLEALDWKAGAIQREQSRTLAALRELSSLETMLRQERVARQRMERKLNRAAIELRRLRARGDHIPHR